MFVRNINYSQRHGPKKDATNNYSMLRAFVSPVLLSPILFGKDTDKNNAHKAYLTRNADKKANIRILKNTKHQTLKMQLTLK